MDYLTQSNPTCGFPNFCKTPSEFTGEVIRAEVIVLDIQSSPELPAVKPVLASACAVGMKSASSEDAKSIRLNQWISSLELPAEYASLLMEDGFDNRLALQSLDDNDLLQMGISKKGHRRALLKAVTQLPHQFSTVCLPFFSGFNFSHSNHY